MADEHGNSLEELGRDPQGTVGLEVFPGRLQMLGADEALDGRPAGDPGLSPAVQLVVTDALTEVYSSALGVEEQEALTAGPDGEDRSEEDAHPSGPYDGSGRS
jgi:hypothetical protein